MTRLAIINADDFGISESVNQAVIQAYTQGILTSASLMVTGAAFEQAVTLARSHLGLAVGLHLVLVCGQSALPVEQVSQLVDADGNFSNDPVAAGLCYQFNSAARRQLRQEIRAQLERFRTTGLPLSHVDGHLHLHMHPVVLNILAELAEEFGIRAIRLPVEELSFSLNYDRQNWLQKSIWATVFGQLRRYGEHISQAHGIVWNERVYGLLQTGAITETYLLDLIPRIQANRIEIYCHPSIEETGSAELAALLSPKVRQALTQQGFELGCYADL